MIEEADTMGDNRSQPCRERTESRGGGWGLGVGSTARIELVPPK